MKYEDIIAAALPKYTRINPAKPKAEAEAPRIRVTDRASNGHISIRFYPEAVRVIGAADYYSVTVMQGRIYFAPATSKKGMKLNTNQDLSRTLRIAGGRFSNEGISTKALKGVHQLTKEIESGLYFIDIPDGEQLSMLSEPAGLKNESATEAQIAHLRSLCIQLGRDMPEGLSKIDAMTLIAELINEKKGV